MTPGDENDYGEPTRTDEGPRYGGTRLRLPEDDPYGGARRAARGPSRSMVTVVGVVVVLIAAIAFANRGGDDSSSGPSATTGGDKPNATSTTPTGTKPVRSKTGGIPVGYAHTSQGAQSAAANYAVALGSADMFLTDLRHQIVDTVYTPDAAAAKKTALDSAYASERFLSNIGLAKDGTAPEGQTFVSRVIPVGTKATAATSSKATVEVWYTSLFGLSGAASTNPVSESWFTTTYQLSWVDNDWKITGFQQKDGPVPVGRDQRASTADDMTKAVEEFGGFTYAR